MTAESPEVDEIALGVGVAKLLVARTVSRAPLKLPTVVSCGGSETSRAKNRSERFMGYSRDKLLGNSNRSARSRNLSGYIPSKQVSVDKENRTWTVW